MNKEKAHPLPGRAAILALALLAVFVGGWEWHWRAQGFVPTFNDDKTLWAVQRMQAYADPAEATVFIGSSRIKFDLDIPRWERITGERAVQLSLVGTSPRLLLQDLADDTSFRGKLVVDITEVLFFSQNPAFQQSAKEAIAYYLNETPSEKAGAAVQHALESRLAFLEERRFSLHTLLEGWNIPNRAGVFAMPVFPRGFEWTTRDRQTYMSEMFLRDSAAINRQTGIWQTLIMGDKTPPVSGAALQAIIEEVRMNVARIRARGGKVVFVRTPSSGPMATGEQTAYPREKYWQALLSATGAPGIHYADDPVTAKMICPEWSHLGPSDVLLYTDRLAASLRALGWFAKNQNN